MAPSKSDQPAAAELMNRMNMLLARHSSEMHAVQRTAASITAGNGTAAPIAAAARKPKSSFSAMKNPSASLPTTTSTTTAAVGTSKPITDDDDEVSGNINAGLGFVPAGKEVVENERTAATRDLRGKLLGKRAREQKDDARRKKLKARDGDESDEDEGRSKIGKGRKKTIKAVVEDNS